MDSGKPLRPVTKSFIDSNVLVYALDTSEPTKRIRAQETLAGISSYVLSARVLGEVCVTITRKLRPAYSPDEARSTIASFTKAPIVPLDHALVRAAMHTSDTAQLSYWDALIIEAAVAGGCDRVLTEDLADGAEIRGVRIVNPFA